MGRNMDPIKTPGRKLLAVAQRNMEKSLLGVRRRDKLVNKVKRLKKKGRRPKWGSKVCKRTVGMTQRPEWIASDD